MKKYKYILTDLDNSVLDFGPYFEDWAENAGYTIERGIINQTYHLDTMFPEGLDVSIDELLDQFFSCDTAASNFPARENTIEPIKRLRQKGHEFIGITACAPREGLSELRNKNMEKLFGFEFNDLLVTGYDQCKGSTLSNYEPTIWVEDNLAHARVGADLGHTVFLIDHAYNQGDGPFTRVKDWLAIEEYLDALR